MIITCPECTTRFMIADQALGDNGRTVRCSKCSHTWFQSKDDLAVEEESLAEEDTVDSDEYEDAQSTSSEKVEEYVAGTEEEEDDDGDFPVEAHENSPPPISDEEDFDVPIPAGIRPRAETLLEEEEQKDAESSAYKYGLLASLFLVICIAGGLYFLKPMVIDIYPPVRTVYQLVGLGAPIPGQNLELERLNAYEGEGVIEIHGQITNLNATGDEAIPGLAVALVANDDSILGHAYIVLQKETIPAGEVYRFREVIDNKNNQASAVILRFATEEEEQNIDAGSQTEDDGSEHDETIHEETGADEHHDTSHDTHH